MYLHLYLTKYKALYEDFSNIQETVKQKIQVAIMEFRHTDVSNSIFAENLLIKQVDNDFLLIFWDDKNICAYFVNEFNIIVLEFPNLDYSDKLLYKEFVDVKNKFIKISFRCKKEDFRAMIAPIAITYGFHINRLSDRNIIIGEVVK